MSNARVYINEKTSSQSFTVIINRGFVEGIVEYCMDRGIFYERQMVVQSKRINTRATKPAKFIFEKSAPTVPIPYEQMGLTKPIYMTRTILLHGAGVSIDELQSLMNTAEL